MFVERYIMICNNMELCNLCTFTIIEHHITAFSSFLFFSFFGNNEWGNGDEGKKKKRKQYLILYIKICIHTFVPYHIFVSLHPSSLIPLSLSLSLSLFTSSLLFPPFLSFYLLKKDTHTASHSAYKTASESVLPEFLSQPISLAFPPNGAQR